jgi:uncharacterized caspase-like protein
VGFRTHFLALAALIVGLIPAGVSARDVAIVIGNSEYSYLSRLPNEARDAEAISTAMSDLGYEVFTGANVTLQQLRKLLVDATSDSTKIDTLLFFYAGHGVQMGGSNYLLAANADGTDQRSLRKGSMDIADIVQELRRFSTSTVIILDACRNNPFESGSFGATASASANGLSDFGLPAGSYVAFSTEPGRAALEGGGRNSPFTEALLRHIRTPGATIHDIMLRVRKDVSDTTGGAQTPWEKSALTQRIVFTPEENLSAQPAAPAIAPVMPQVTQYPPTHEVRGLDPQGDGFLSLRVAPAGNTSELRKLIEGTKLAVLGTQGSWYRVRLADGQEGWAHSNWVAPIGAAPATIARPTPQVPPVPQTALAGQSCDALWYQRNKIFDDHGYCFTSARGQAVFSNVGCNPAMTGGAVPLTSTEKTLIAQIRALEKQQGC